MNPLLQLQQSHSSDGADGGGGNTAALRQQLEAAQEEKKVVFKELEQFFIAQSCHPHMSKRSSLSLVSSSPAGNSNSGSSSSPLSPRAGLSYSSSAISTTASSSTASSPISILENFKKLLYQYEEKVCQVYRLSQTINTMHSSTATTVGSSPAAVSLPYSSQPQPPPPPPPPPSSNNKTTREGKSSLRSSLLRSKSGQ